MLTRDDAKAFVDRVLSRSQADATSVLLTDGQSALTRFGENVITQNVAERTTQLRVHVVIGQKEACAATNQLDDAAIDRTLEAARVAALLQPDNPDLLPFQGQAEKYEPVKAYAEAGLTDDPGQRARLVAEGVATCRDLGLDASGVCDFESRTVYLANSAGLFVDYPSTSASFNLTAMDGDAAGWAMDRGFCVDELDTARVVQTATDKAVRARGAVALPAGDYDVILEPAAVGDLVMFLNWFALNALGYIEGRSPLAGKLGETIFHESFTLRDDPFHPDVQGLPFDFEGTPRRPVTFFDKGKFVALAHDRVSAKKMDTTSTGHSMPKPNPGGGAAFSLSIDPGTASLADLVADTKRGLYITQFHYNNIHNLMKASVTGMTRNGLWLIEDGKITQPAKNFRYTESLLHAFNHIDGISADRERRRAFFGGTSVVPGMRIRDFTMSSSTEF